MMSSTKNSHATKLYGDAFRLLISKKQEWPSYFTYTMKRDLIQHHLDFWEDIQEFKKCVKLHQALKDLKKSNEIRLNNTRPK